MILSKFKNNKEVIAWSLYDFANQPFTTIIVSFIYSAFFVEVIAPDSQVGTTLWANAIALTAICVSILSPILGAIADNRGYRRFFLLSFTLICSVFTILLYFPQEGDVMLALSIFIIANISFEMGSVFCNSYLPDLSNNHNSGKISGFAWGLGFIGGLLALLISFALFPELSGDSIRKINILVGLWFLFFSIPTFTFIKDRRKDKLTKKNIFNSLLTVQKTFRSLSKYRQITQFLIARLFFNDGLITIFALGGVYAVGTINFTFEEVMLLGIVLNLCAGIGSFIFGFLEDKIGSKKVINITLIGLIISTFIGFIAPDTNSPKAFFWASGIIIGLMVGPNQSCSRSLMSKIIPSNKKNEFFGFFALTGKATSFIGPLMFGIITSYYNQQMALWVVIILFIVGFLLFNRISFNLLNSQNDN